MYGEPWVGKPLKDVRPVTTRAREDFRTARSFQEFGLFDVFKAGNVHVQAFMCPAGLWVQNRQPFTSVSYVAARIGDDRLVWKRPDDSFDPARGTKAAYGEHLNILNEKFELYVNGELTEPNNQSFGFGWLQEDKTPDATRTHRTQSASCLGTHDGQFVMRVSEYGIPMVFDGTLQIEVAEEFAKEAGPAVFDDEGQSLCQGRNPRDYSLPFTPKESVFSKKELNEMCDKCGLNCGAGEGTVTWSASHNGEAITRQYTTRDAHQLCQQRRQNGDMTQDDYNQIMNECNRANHRVRYTCLMEGCIAGDVAGAREVINKR